MAKLIRLSEGPLRSNRSIILVHGIFSNHEQCFGKFIENLRHLGAETDFELWAFDYDFYQHLTDSADLLARSINGHQFAPASVDIIGHSMGGLVARLAAVRNPLPSVRRLVTLATPNHGALNGVQLNIVAQLAFAVTKKVHPLYVRAPGIFDLNQAHKIMSHEIRANCSVNPNLLDGKSWISIPAQYYHSKLQLGDPPPSLTMGGLTLFMRLLNRLAKQKLLKMEPVHDGIVEERSNQLHPAPAGSLSEASYLPGRLDPDQRILHVTHDEGSRHDHVTITGCSQITELILAVLRANGLQASDIDPLLSAPVNQVHLRPPVT